MTLSLRTNKALYFMTAGDLVQLMGGHFFSVAIATHTYAMTGAAWAYALQMLVSFLPWMLFPGIAGPIVDRLDRRSVMVAAALLRGLLGLMYPYFETIEPVLALNFVSSACGVFLVTARTALIPALAEKDALLKVNGLRTAAFGCVDLVIPTLAGAVMGWMGTTAAFRLISLCWILGAVSFRAIPARGRIARPERPGETVTRRGSGRDLRDATSFLRGQRALLGSIAVYTVYVAGQNGTNTLFYPYVETVLNRGPEFFGLSMSVYFGANLLAGLLLARFGRTLKRLPMVALAVPAAFVWFSYSVVRNVPLILFMGFVEGMIMSLLSTLFMTEVQSKSPHEMTGRVWGVASSVNGGGQVLGILLAGAIAGRYGPLPAYRVCGSLILALVVLAEVARRLAVPREDRLTRVQR